MRTPGDMYSAVPNTAPTVSEGLQRKLAARDERARVASIADARRKDTLASIQRALDANTASAAALTAKLARMALDADGAIVAEHGDGN